MRIPVHLGRGPVEAAETGIAAFYDGLLECLKDPAFRDGDWQLLECRPAWDGNGTWDSFVAFSWTGPGERAASSPSTTPSPRASATLRCRGATSTGGSGASRTSPGPAVYDRAGGDLTSQGLYLDMPAWGYHVFAVSHAR